MQKRLASQKADTIALKARIYPNAQENVLMKSLSKLIEPILYKGKGDRKIKVAILN